jgi:hypothetical protein
MDQAESEIQSMPNEIGRASRTEDFPRRKGMASGNLEFVFKTAMLLFALFVERIKPVVS